MKNTCPCCGYKTLDNTPPGTYEICGICFWEDDIVRLNTPDYEGGVNGISLRTAKQNFAKFGACDEVSINTVRKPTCEDERDDNWHPTVINEGTKKPPKTKDK